MSKVLRFRVYVNGLDKKLYREIEVREENSLAELVYIILASFDSLAFHLYKVGFNNKIYGPNIDDVNDIHVIDAAKIELSKLSLKKEDKMKMVYDFGTPTNIIIKYLGSKPLKKGYYNVYPHISDGKGKGIIDDISSNELIEIIKKTDSQGLLEYYTPGYNREEKYDYRVYDRYNDNVDLKQKIKLIKFGYEEK